MQWIWKTKLRVKLKFSRNCDDNQNIFNELSTKVDKVTYNAGVNIIMSLYENCNNSKAWNSANVERYQRCTNQISKSNPVIERSMSHIESFAVNCCTNMSLYTKLEQILEDIEFDSKAVNRLVNVVSYIRNKTHPSMVVVRLLHSTMDLFFKIS